MRTIEDFAKENRSLRRDVTIYERQKNLSNLKQKDLLQRNILLRREVIRLKTMLTEAQAEVAELLDMESSRPAVPAALDYEKMTRRIRLLEDVTVGCVISEDTPEVLNPPLANEDDLREFKDSYEDNDLLPLIWKNAEDAKADLADAVVAT